MTRPAWYNEIDPWCCERLRERIAAGDLPAGHVDERDVRLVSPTDLQGYGQLHFFAGIGGGALACRLAGLPDDFPIVTGGVPCQPASQAGKRLGENDERWLWPQFLALVGDRVLRFHYVLAENPAGILTLADGAAWAGIMAALAEGGRDAEWIPVSAADVGSSHERERIWLVAYPNVDTRKGWAEARVAGEGRRTGTAQQQDVRSEGESCADHTRSSREALADADHAGRGEQRGAVAVGSELAAPEHGGEGRGAGHVADTDGGPRTRGPWRSSVGARAEIAGTRDDRDAIGEVADADGAGLCRVAAHDSANGGVDVEPGDDADGCGDHQHGAVGREADEGRDGARPAESSLGGYPHGVPAYLGGTEWPAPPGQPQHPWEEPRLVADIGPDGRKALAAYGNAWVPQAAIPALHIILAHAGGAR